MGNFELHSLTLTLALWFFSDAVNFCLISSKQFFFPLWSFYTLGLQECYSERSIVFSYKHQKSLDLKYFPIPYFVSLAWRLTFELAISHVSTFCMAYDCLIYACKHCLIRKKAVLLSILTFLKNKMNPIFTLLISKIITLYLHSLV